MRFEKLQTDLDEGPCVLAYESRHPRSPCRGWARRPASRASRRPRCRRVCRPSSRSRCGTATAARGARPLPRLPRRARPARPGGRPDAGERRDGVPAQRPRPGGRPHSTDRLRHIATHDALTGLPNRRLLMERIEHARERRSASHAAAGVLFVDLDRFKLVNDTYGHRSATCCCRPSPTGSPGWCARVTRSPGSTATSSCCCARTCATAPTWRCSPSGSGRRSSRRYHRRPGPAVTASVGVAFAGPGEEVSERMVADADQAMYDAKRASRKAGRALLGSGPGEEPVDDLALAIEHEADGARLPAGRDLRRRCAGRRRGAAALDHRRRAGGARRDRRVRRADRADPAARVLGARRRLRRGRALAPRARGRRRCSST